MPLEMCAVYWHVSLHHLQLEKFLPLGPGIQFLQHILQGKLQFLCFKLKNHVRGFK